MRPSTGMARPGTGVRPSTAQRLGTAAGYGGGGGRDGTGTAAGLRPSTSAGRQVQDASYFVALLRNKATEVAAETQRLRAEAERSARGAASVATMERQYDALVKEVRGLEGELADHNLALDKARSGVDAAEVAGYAAAISRRNADGAREADAVFVERADRERGAARLEEQVAELRRVAEARLASLPPECADEFRRLGEENAALAAAIGAQQAELEGVNGAIEAAHAELARDRAREECGALEKRLAHLRRERAALEDEMRSTRLPPAEAREALLARVKADTARIQEVDQRINEVDAEAESKRQAAAEVAADAESRRGAAGDAANLKYEALFQRDQEMTEFLDRFDTLRAKELAEAERLEAAAAPLLERIAEAEDAQRHVPSAAQAADMRADADDKRREVDAARATADRLPAELKERRAELERVSSLDERLRAEIESLEQRRAEMEAELPRLRDIGGLKAAAEAAKATLLAHVKAHDARRDAARPELAALRAQLEERRAALLRDPQATALAAAEAKLRVAEENVHALREFISAKTRDGDYAALKTDVVRMTGEANLMLQRALLRGVPGGPGTVAAAAGGGGTGNAPARTSMVAAGGGGAQWPQR